MIKIISILERNPSGIFILTSCYFWFINGQYILVIGLSIWGINPHLCFSPILTDFQVNTFKGEPIHYPNRFSFKVSILSFRSKPVILKKNSMPIYHKLGSIPPKRHTIFEKPGGGIYYEQLLERWDLTGWPPCYTIFTGPHRSKALVPQGTLHLPSPSNETLHPEF